MKIYIINGNTDLSGQWEVEIYTEKEKAMKQFAEYVEEYNAEIDTDYDHYKYAVARDEDGDPAGWFELEEREIN